MRAPGGTPVLQIKLGEFCTVPSKILTGTGINTTGIGLLSNRDRFAEQGRGEPRGSRLLLLRCSDGGSDIRHDLKFPS